MFDNSENGHILICNWQSDNPNNVVIFVFDNPKIVIFVFGHRETKCFWNLATYIWPHPWYWVKKVPPILIILLFDPSWWDVPCSESGSGCGWTRTSNSTSRAPNRSSSCTRGRTPSSSWGSSSWWSASSDAAGRSERASACCSRWVENYFHSWSSMVIRQSSVIRHLSFQAHHFHVSVHSIHPPCPRSTPFSFFGWFNIIYLWAIPTSLFITEIWNEVDNICQLWFLDITAPHTVLFIIPSSMDIVSTFHVWKKWTSLVWYLISSLEIKIQKFTGLVQSTTLHINIFLWHPRWHLFCFPFFVPTTSGGSCSNEQAMT